MITVILVTHNSSFVLAAALGSIDPATPVIIVDNASTDDTCQMAVRCCPRATLIRSTENLGFGHANNLALGQVNSEFALLLNPDAVLQPGCCKALLEAAALYPQAAIVAPVLINEDGSEQTNYKGSLFKRRSTYIAGRPEGDICAEYVSGAVMLLRMASFKEIGFFDPHIFMFYEDDDLCLRVIRAGYSIIVASQAVAMHLSGQSSPLTFRMLYRKNWHMQWSRLYMEEKYHDLPAVRKIIIQEGLRYLLKSFGYILLLGKKKSVKSIARLSATIFYLIK